MVDEKQLKKDLEKIYEADIKIKWKDFRYYEIRVSIEIGCMSTPLFLQYMYDPIHSYEFNLHNIEDKIDEMIVNYFRKEVRK